MDQAFLSCCALGMELAGPETYSCLIEATSGTWNDHRAFWTPMYRPSCNKPYKSCVTGREVTRFWLPFEPTCEWNLETEAAFYVSTEINGLKSWINRMRLPYVCEGDSKPPDDKEILKEALLAWLKQKPPKLNNERYTIISAARPDKSCTQYLCLNSKNKTTRDKNGRIIVKSAFGSVIDACGKRYVISKQRSSYNGAWSACCANGLILASITSRKELNCLNEAASSILNPMHITLYVAVQDSNLDKNFQYCRKNNTLVPQDIWLPGQPDNYGREEACGTVMLSSAKVSGLGDSTCSGFLTFFFLCEDPSYNDSTKP